ncbi:PLP-dependent aminotransferase family protein [Jannaschia sp. LMIT008]|uniref:aminotransferase-like domain-containing protein n=1 Tax=Jannaschia maritima TaxID=3032585 RepID=UPI0035ABAF83
MIHVDFGAADRPKYVVLEGAVRQAVVDGTLPVGTKLPPVRELAWTVGVTPGTVARVYRALTDAGLLEASVGRGTFVADRAPPPPIYEEFQPLAVDSTPHRTGGDVDRVDMLSPHLPAVGQTGLIRSLLAEIAADPPSGLMHYPVFAAERPTREAAAAFLRNDALGPLEPDDITLTHGGQHGIALVLQTVLRTNRPTVLVEELSYPGFRRLAELLRASVGTVPADEHGILPDALDDVATRTGARVLCTSPDLQNPTLAVMPLERRRRIVEVARRHDLQILEDDCYLMTPSGIDSFRKLAPERTWHVSSVAKTISPALRLGFAMAPPSAQMALRRSAEYNAFGLATPMSDLAAKLLVHPDLRAIMDAVRDEVGRYVAIARDGLRGHDLRCRDDASFLWLTLPPGWRASAFCRAAEGAGVKLRAAEEYAARDANAPHAVRFAVNGGVTHASYARAIARLRALLDDPMEGPDV